MEEQIKGRLELEIKSKFEEELRTCLCYGLALELSQKEPIVTVSITELDSEIGLYQIKKTLAILFKPQQELDEIYNETGKFLSDDDKFELLSSLTNIDGYGIDVDDMEYWVWDISELKLL